LIGGSSASPTPPSRPPCQGAPPELDHWLRYSFNLRRLVELRRASTVIAADI
jgi:hypothetical protein